MSEKLRLTIAYEEPDEDGWIVARVVEVPGRYQPGPDAGRGARERGTNWT